MNTVQFDNFKEYILYLYIHIAYADGEIQSQEKSMILRYMEKLFPNDNNLEEVFNKWLDIYNSSSENCDEIIRSGNQQFPEIDFHKKYKIFIQLYEIIGADGVVEEAETTSINKLKEIINLEVGE